MHEIIASHVCASDSHSISRRNIAVGQQRLQCVVRADRT